MKTFNKIMAAALVCLGLASCNVNELVPDSVDKSVSFAKKSLNIGKAGDTQIIGVNAKADWTLGCDANWVKLAPLSGTSATKSITVTVDTPNETEEDRVALVIITNAANPSQTDTLKVTHLWKDTGSKIIDAESFIAFLENAGSYSDSDEIEVDADIDLGGATLTPAGSFLGILNGKNHKIYNFKIESAGTSASLIVENKGTIENLIIGSKDGASPDKATKISFASGASGCTSAGIVGVNHGTISGVKNFATIDFNGSTTDADAAVGGIAGRLGSSTAVVSDCHNYGTITFTGTLGARGSIGGILGVNMSSGTSVQNCVNHADIVQGTRNAKEFAMGGVVGRAQAMLNLVDCTNEGAVSYTCTDAPGSYIHIAGVIAAEYFGCVISGCVNKGPISSCINQVDRMGGIVGTINTGGQVSNCHNYGTITLEQPTNANWQAVGGIVGFEEKCSNGEGTKCLIQNCINEGAIKVAIDNATTHANQAVAGGIIGLTCSYSEILDNTNQGNVAMTNIGGANTYAGGIVGWNSKGVTTVKNNTNKAAVSSTCLAGAAGGVMGAVSAASSTIESDTNLGVISCAVCAGSIAGVSAATLTTCAVGGTVNDTVLSESNFNNYIKGSGSGAAVSCYFPGGEAPKDYITVSPETLTFVAAGESKDLAVASNCDWTVTSSAAWLTVSPAEGNGEVKTVTVTAAENPDKTERSATVTITSKTDASLTASVAVTQAEHVDGLAGNKIASAADLKTFLALAADAAAEDTYTLEADVDYGGATIVPAASFAGTLDGKNHKIYNFKVSGEGATGIIGNNTGTIKDLIIGSSNGTSYDGTSIITAATAPTHVGVIGQNSGTISNVKNFATVKCAVGPTVSNGGVGGIVGYSTGGTITGCENYAQVVVDENVTLTQETRIGGVVGRADGEQTISLCTNNAELTVTTKTAKVIMMGGIAGVIQNGAAVSECTNAKPVSYVQTVAPGTWMAIGGVLGALYTGSSVTKCVNNGKVSSDLNQVVRIGGISGVMNSGGTAEGNVNNAEVALTQTANNNWQAAAGIIGFEEKGTADVPVIIKGNTNNGEVKVTVENATTHANKVAAGGILGTSCSVTEVTENINKAAVTVVNTSTVATYAGGVIGWYFKGSSFTSKGNENSGNVTVNAEAGFAGGVIGSANVSGASLSSDKSNAAVKGNTAGAIAGENNGSIATCSAGGTVNDAAVTAANIQGSGSGTHTGDVIL